MTTSDPLQQVRHDIKNHLTAINGFAEILERTINGTNHNTAVMYSHKIKDRVRLITELVNQLKPRE